MSVKLFKLFVNTLRQNLPKYTKPGLTGNQLRSVAAMDIKTEIKEDDLVRNKNGTRYKRRFVKRQWEETSKKGDGETDEKKERTTERIKRKKMVLMLGYCGVDYYGMQRNPGVRTIEEDLLKALLEAKYITEEDFSNQQNAQFQRSSRTDKGVSAARQVVSMKLPLEINIDEINKRLPECIKVFGVKRVTNKFNSKITCNARTYSYTLPTYTFEPSLVTEEERKKYRISEEKLEQIKNILGLYKGTKSYHNFTERKHHQDPSASRYMMGFSIEKVFVESDMEFVALQVKGQSFMLHQIRKMIGLAIAVIRGQTDMTMMDKAFGKEKIIIPTAPGLGLVLDTVHYDRYDSKFKDSHGSLTWEAEEESVQKFKHEHIYPNIIKGEIEGNSIGFWLEKLSTHSYEPSEEGAEEKETENEEKCMDEDDDDEIDEEEMTEKHEKEVIKKSVSQKIEKKELVEKYEKQLVEKYEKEDCIQNCEQEQLTDKCENEDLSETCENQVMVEK